MANSLANQTAYLSLVNLPHNVAVTVFSRLPNPEGYINCSPGAMEINEYLLVKFAISAKQLPFFGDLKYK